MIDNKFDINPYKILKSLVEVTAPHLGEEFLRIICDELKKLFDADLVFITKSIDFNPTTKVEILYATKDSLPNSFELGGTPCQLVFNDEVIQISKGLNLKFEKSKDTSYESFYGIPLHNDKNKCIGHIAIFSNKQRVIPKEIEEIILIFARRIEVEYERNLLEKENKKITEQLEKLTVTDSLTGIYNRRYFDKFSEETLNRVKRLDCKATLSFLDIDDFKQLNDTYGHEQGDKVLQYLSNILVKNARKGIEHVFRIGGEEFAIISINSSIENSIAYLSRVNKELEDFIFSPDISITLSIGVDSFKRKDKNSDDAYKRADNKMYEAKTCGKNCIIK